MLQIEIDQVRCNGCGTCADFCPVSVFEMQGRDGDRRPAPLRIEDCWGCDTCVGQCPTGALRVVQPPSDSVSNESTPQARLDPHQQWQCYEWSSMLERVLRLRWKPVAISLIQKGAALPDVPGRGLSCATASR